MQLCYNTQTSGGLMTDFVSLHNQTDFSILDSLISTKALFKRAKELGQSAVAITDHGSLAAAWDAVKASKDTGVKLIIGCECYFQNDATSVDEKFRHVIFLAKNAVGYRNLLTLNKKGFDQSSFVGKRVYSVIDWKLLEQYSEGLICLTACGNGIVSQLLMKHKTSEAEETLLRLQKIFGDDLGIEVQPNNMKRGSNIFNDEIDQFFLNRQLISLGKKLNIRVVAACNAHYLTKEEAETHDVFLAIGSHQPIYSNFRLRYPVPEFYLKSGDEVKSFFVRNYGEEVAQSLCDNSIYFADRCEKPDWIDPKYSNPSGKELPVFPVKDEPDYVEFIEWRATQPIAESALEEDKAFLRFHCQKFFSTRIKDLNASNMEQYQNRLSEELDVLEYHGFSSYMLIVADFIEWARKHEIAVGEGRGSVGGSLIGFLLGIHQADPIKYGLIFARFHNKEKSSFPDIDTDFAPSGREKVQNYLRKKYGNENVAHVSNVNTITPKVYVRDIARSCELGGSKEEAVKIGNDVADCIPADIHSIDEALAKVPLFAEYAKKYTQFEKYKSICGKFRAWSTHAGGIIISARPLTGLVPLRKDKDGALAIEYDKDKAEENGLVKMDTLGLSTLDIIGQTLQLIKEAGKEPPPDPINYDEYDQATYDVISNGDTFCVFQLGTSGGTIDLGRRIKPKSINDISYINSLARPSARDMRNDFIQTKDGKKAFSLLHPNLGRAFNNTFGFGLYEESLMYLAQDIAGWSLHSADRLRKLTKEKGKNPKKAQEWRAEFIRDAVKNNNINEGIAKRIWDEVVDKFQGYGFNMSHSILYSMTSYKTAYLKAHYPVEFLMANLMAEVKSNTPDANINIEKIKKELRKHRVKIVPPDINKSQLVYTIEDGNRLVTGLDAIKFVGEDAIKDIISKRPFKDFFDFMTRISSKSVRANSIQALAACGALDSFGMSRKQIFLYCSDYRKKLQVWLKKHNPDVDQFTYPYPSEPDWTEPEKFALEQYYIGESFICKPAVAHGVFFKDAHITIHDVKKSKDKTNISSTKGIIRDFFEFRVKKEGKYYGQPMVKAVLEDKNADQCTLTIFPDRWKMVKERIQELNKKVEFGVGIALHFSGSTNIYEDDMGIILDQLFNISLPPVVPSDLKAKKINLKEAKAKLSEDNPKDTLWKNPKNSQEIVDQIEDTLYDEGLIDLEDDLENSDDD
jgi:DNA polymerase III subunit alpha